MRRLVLAVAALAAAAGCGGSTSGGHHHAAPACSALVGKDLTRAAEAASCTDHGALQVTAELKCAKGTMVAFGNVIGGYIGRPAQAGNFADWHGCTPA